MTLRRRLADGVVDNRRIVLVALVVLTGVVAAGMASIETTGSADSYGADDPVVTKTDYVDRQFDRRGANVTRMTVAVRDPGGDVLTRESLLDGLRLQQRIRTNETVAPTLVEERPTYGLENVVATAIVARERAAGGDGSAAGGDRGDGTARNASPGRSLPEPSLDRQVAALEAATDSEVDAVLSALLTDGSGTPGAADALALLPKDHEPGSTTAEARLLVVTQRIDGGQATGFAFDDATVDAQVAVRGLALVTDDDEESVAVFGRGLFTWHELRASTDNFVLLGPLALLVVLTAFAVAYRDPLDVVVGVVGVALSLVWTMGLLGWASIPFNRLISTVPFLLIGLSVDYAIHVFMRYREERATADAGVVDAMRTALGGVGAALVLVTVTTTIGFLANYASSVPSVRAMGLATALGIVATLVVFTLVVPPLKVELDLLLERFGVDRDRRAFGTTGVVGGLLRVGATAARRAPVAVVALALLLAAFGAYGGTQVQPSYSTTNVLADDPPEWVKELPEPFAPDDYRLKSDTEYVMGTFQSRDRQVSVLVEGDVTADGTLDRVRDAERAAGEQSVTYAGPDGEAAVDSPLSVMARTAARNASFAGTLRAADADGDGVPDRDLAGVYDALYAAAPEAARTVVHRTDDGRYDALRLTVAVEGSAGPSDVAGPMRHVAAVVEGGTAATGTAATEAGDDDGGAGGDGGGGGDDGGDGGGGNEGGDGSGLTATPTGQLMVNQVVNVQLTDTVVRSLGFTLLAVFALLVLVYRLTAGSASLGAVTLVPVACSVSWLLGTMHLLDVPFTFITAIVGSVAIGLGVDYAIHVSERFAQELDRLGDVGAALETTVTGTGGALLGSTATTGGGFGVLGLSLVAGIRQFGVVIALSLVYALVACVFVLPSLLALWARYGPASAVADGEVASGESAASAEDD